jgi:tetratricopeptide (TPR) repeat protein
MPPRVNKKLLLIIVAVVLVLVVGATVWVIFGRPSGVRRQKVVEDADSYRASGQTQKERFVLERWIALEPKDAEIRMRLARLLDAGGQLGEAYNEYRNVIRHDPLNMEALLRIARFEGQFQRWGEMRRVAKVVVDLSPKNAQARLYVAQACLGLGPDYLLEGLENAREALASDPKNVEIYLTLARIHQERRALDEVKKVLDEALVANPRSQELYSFLGAYHMRLGEKEKAEAALKAALENAGDVPRAHIELGSYYTDAKDWVKAEAEFKAACDNATGQMGKVTSRVALGDFYIRRNRMDEAIKQYDEALVALPAAPVVLLKKAQVYLTQKKYEEARKTLEEVKSRARRDPYQVEALFLNGHRLLLLGRTDEAIDELSQALSLVRTGDLRINTAEIQLALAQGYLRREDAAAAREALLAAHAEAPDSARITMALAQVLFNLREYDQVISILDTPRKPYEGFLVQARAYMARGNRGDDREARSQLLKAQSLQPDDPDIHLELGRLAVLTQKYDEAVQRFDETIKLRPNNMIARLSKAVTYEADKKPANAEQTYQEALAVLPKVVRVRYEYARFLARNKRFDEGEKLLLDEIRRLADDAKSRKEYEDQMPRYYMASGKTDKAVEWYRKQAEKDPKDMEVRQTLVLLGLSRGQKEDVVRYLDEIKKVEKADSPRVLRLEGQYLVTQQQYAEGLKKLLAAEKDDPRDPDVQYYIGLCYLRTGEAGKARVYMEKVSTRFPTNERVMRALAEIYYTLGNMDEAKGLAERLKAAGQGGLGLDIILYDSQTKTGDLEEGEAGWRGFTTKNPERPEGWIGLSDALWREGKRPEAIEALRKGYDLEGRSFRTTWTLANMYMLQKDFDKAVTVTRDSLGEKNDNLPLLGLLARLYELSDKPEEARKVYVRIGELDPKNPLPAISQGDRALEKRDLAAAEAAYREALRLRPDNPIVRTRLVEVLVNENKPSDAVAVIDSVLDKNPDDIGLTVLKARVRVAENKPEEGIRLFKRAAKLSRDARIEERNYLIHYELAQLYLALGRLGEARQSLESACALSPDFVDGRLGLVQIAIKQGQLSEARAGCLQIVEKKPNLLATITLGDIALAENDLKAARTYYDRAAKEFPGESLPRRKQVGLLLREKKTDAAVTELKKILELEKQNPQTLAMLVDVLVSENRFTEAIGVLKESLDKTPDPAAVYLFMGNVEQSRKQYAKAREYYDMSLDKKGDSPAVYLAKAQSYLSEGSVNGALEEARQALKVNPKYETAYMFMEQVYRSGKQDKEVEQLYAGWVSAVPESVVASNNYAWFLAEVKGEADAGLKVVDTYRRRMGSAGKDFVFGAELDDTEGRAYFRKGDYRRAAELFRRSLESRRDSAKTWEHLRLACVKLLERAREQNDPSAAQRYEIEVRDAFTKVRELSQDVPEMQVQLGDVKFGEGKLDEAIQAYERALELKMDRDVERKLAEVLVRDGRTERAKKYVEDLVKAEPKEPRNLILQGMLLSRMGENQKAVELLEDVVAKYPNAHMAHYVLSQEYVAQNRLDKGRAELDKTIALVPQFLGARLVKARLLAAEGKLDEGVAECKMVLQSDPTNFEAAFNMGNFLLGQGKVNEAESSFKSMTQKWPESVLAHERLAETYHRANRLGESLLEYQDCRRRDPRSLLVLRGMSAVLQTQGKADQAIREYGTYLEDSPNATDAWLDLAGLYGANQQWSDVERSIKSAIRTAHTNPEVHRALVDFYTGRRMFPEARAAATRLMLDIPTKQGRAVGYTCIARAYEVEGKLDEAAKEYRRALAEDPEMVVAANNLGWLLATKTKQVDEALKVVEPYLKKYPGFAELLDTAGWAYRLNNEPKKGEPLLAQAVQLQIVRGQVMPTILYHYGEVLFINGKNTDAKRVLELATKVRFPEYDRAMEILSKIK